MWNLLCILKSKGLTKSKEKSVRITVLARHTVTVLPFAKLKLAVLITEERLQADLCYGEMSLTTAVLPPDFSLVRTKCRREPVAHCKPSYGVVQVTVLPAPLAKLKRRQLLVCVVRRKWVAKVRIRSSPQFDVNSKKFYVVCLAKVRQLCSHPHLP